MKTRAIVSVLTLSASIFSGAGCKSRVAASEAKGVYAESTPWLWWDSRTYVNMHVLNADGGPFFCFYKKVAYLTELQTMLGDRTDLLAKTNAKADLSEDDITVLANKVEIPIFAASDKINTVAMNKTDLEYAFDQRRKGSADATASGTFGAGVGVLMVGASPTLGLAGLLVAPIGLAIIGFNTITVLADPGSVAQDREEALKQYASINLKNQSIPEPAATVTALIETVNGWQKSINGRKMSNPSCPQAMAALKDLQKGS